ncbi:alpha/beta hydrolase (plasmid) [Pseudomonas silvicola]|nr:alpha/beta hydrolase [Pseudomonas silvicola]
MKPTRRCQPTPLCSPPTFLTRHGRPPSWYMVAKADKIINPDLERMYAKRAHSHTVEVAGASHSVYESHPDDVAKLIEQAAQQAQP